MADQIFEFRDLTWTKLDYLILTAIMMSFVTIGPAGLVYDFRKVSTESWYYLEKLTEKFEQWEQFDHGHVFIFTERDLACIREVFLYLRDVYGIETELHSVSGYEMEAFDRALLWIEDMLTAPDPHNTTPPPSYPDGGAA